MNQVADTLRQLSPQQFALLGMDDVAYVKSVMVEGGTGYAIHSADGREVAVLGNRAVAFAAVRQNEMEPVSVH